jgi:Bacterial Ig-like domain/L,D-transpeptidase catalytic domain
VIAGGAAVVMAAGVAIVTVASPGSHAAAVPAAQAAARQDRPAGPLRVLSVTPAAGATGVNGAAPIRVRFSAPLAADTPMSALSPHIAGSWQVEGDTAVFTPAVGYFQDTHVTLKIPGGPDGMTSAGTASARAGGLLVSSVTRSFTTGSFTTLRLQQLLSQLGYLPLTWTPTTKTGIGSGEANAELSAAYQPPAGTFSWTGDYPPDLTDLWRPAWVTSSVLDSAVNTGIAASPTADGTFSVYLRYYFQIMRGTNPDGSHYADPVYYVSYFNGGDAVHYFSRGGYGYDQSLGCVELPWDAAKKAYPYLTYGSLVTVIGPVGG